jgi:hypothetical protein
LLGGKFQGSLENAYNITTRGSCISVSAAAASLGFDKRLVITAPAPRQKTWDPAQGFFRYKLVEAECTAVYDGMWERQHDPAFFSNATVADAKQALAEAGLITVFVVKLSGNSLSATREAAAKFRPSTRKPVFDTNRNAQVL